MMLHAVKVVHFQKNRPDHLRLQVQGSARETLQPGWAIAWLDFYQTPAIVSEGVFSEAIPWSIWTKILLWLTGDVWRLTL